MISESSLFLNNLGLPTLSEDEKQICELPFSKEDLKISLDSMENNKSPGNDGLSREFYVKFWNIIGDILYDSFIAGFIKQELSTSQRQKLLNCWKKRIEIDVS